MSRESVDTSMGRFAARLRRAHAGELAAALAYRHHWRSLRDPRERARVREIEADEWRHRRRVGEMLRDLGAALPAEWRARAVGTALGLLCAPMGRWLPMAVAGLVERRNVREYEDAARMAPPAWTAELQEMARAEAEHERYFFGRIRPRSRRPRE